MTLGIEDEDGNAFEASYKVNYHYNAGFCETHIISENIITPCVEGTVSCVLGSNHLKAIKKKFRFRILQFRYESRALTVT
jgi:hypothetical protein